MILKFKTDSIPMNYLVITGKDRTKEIVTKEIYKFMSALSKEEKKLAVEDVFSYEDPKGLCYRNCGYTVLLLPDESDEINFLSTLSHEVTHATQFTFQRYDTPLEKSTTEIYAYYYQTVFTTIIKEVWKRKSILSK